MLDGYKTYILAALTGLTAAVSASMGADEKTLVALIGIGLSAAVAALRHGVNPK